MFRTVVSAILGYVVMVIVVMLGIAGVWFSMGNEFAFEGETVRASVAWSSTMLGVGFFAACLGGVVAAIVGGPRSSNAVNVLIGMVAILGVLTAASQWNLPIQELPEGKVIGELTFFEAGEFARSPNWYNVAIVIVGMIGVWIGGAVLCRKSLSVESGSV